MTEHTDFDSPFESSKLVFIGQPNECSIPNCHCLKAGTLAICVQEGLYSFGFGSGERSYAAEEQNPDCETSKKAIGSMIANIKVFGFSAFWREHTIVIQSEGCHVVTLLPMPIMKTTDREQEI